jgi:hypothetical protein
VRVRLVVGAAAVAIVAAIAVVVAVVVPSRESRDFGALGERAVQLSSTTTTPTTSTAPPTTTTVPPITAASTTTIAAPPTTTTMPPTTATSPTADSAHCTEGPNCVNGWNLDTCEGYLGAVLSAGRAPSSGEIQYLWLECGIDIAGEAPG